MTYIFRRSIVIHASPEQVYDELLDIGAHKEWGDMTEVELLYSGPAQVGSRWRSVGAVANRVMRDECTIIELDRPHAFGFQSQSRSQNGINTYTFFYRLEPVPEGIRVTFSREFGKSDLKLPFVIRVLLSLPGFIPLMDKLIVAKIADRGLARLRDRVEQAHS